MKLKIEDYLPLYIGCQIITHEEKFRLAGFSESEVEPGIFIAICKLDEPYDSQVFLEFCAEEIKLILRPLSSMTEGEVTHWKAINNATQSPNLKQMAEEIRWLLSEGFDLFNLREAGLALYESDLIK